MTRYLVDYSLEWQAANGDWRREISASNPIELEGNAEAAGNAVAEEARKRFRKDYGKGGDLHIEVTRIAKIIQKAE